MRKFYLIGFVSLFLAITGCVLPGMQPSGKQESAESQQLKHASTLVKAGRYADALDAYRKVIQDQPASADTALAHYGIAMIYLAADNQQKDYAQSLAKLDEFITQYPQHDLAQDARNWRSVIKALLDARRDNDRLNKNIERLKQLDMKQEEKRMGR